MSNPINHGPFNRYVVQSFHDCTQFSDLDCAKRHASLNSPASVWNGDDVTEIHPNGVLAHKAGAQAITIVWK